MQRTIELDPTQLEALECLAAEEHRSVDEVVQLAVGDYLARRRRDWSAWNRRLNEFVAHVRANIPRDVTPEEIEAEIAAARAEVRAERVEPRAAADSADAGSR
jgi:predicted transcriptional regulator